MEYTGGRRARLGGRQARQGHGEPCQSTVHHASTCAQGRADESRTGRAHAGAERHDREARVRRARRGHRALHGPRRGSASAAEAAPGTGAMAAPWPRCAEPQAARAHRAGTGATAPGGTPQRAGGGTGEGFHGRAPASRGHAGLGERRQGRAGTGAPWSAGRDAGKGGPGRAGHGHRGRHGCAPSRGERRRAPGWGEAGPRATASHHGRADRAGGEHRGRAGPASAEGGRGQRAPRAGWAAPGSRAMAAGTMAASSEVGLDRATGRAPASAGRRREGRGGWRGGRGLPRGGARPAMGGSASRGRGAGRVR
jgi:hypothetical protein